MAASLNTLTDTPNCQFGRRQGDIDHANYKSTSTGAVNVCVVLLGGQHCLDKHARTRFDRLLEQVLSRPDGVGTGLAWRCSADAGNRPIGVQNKDVANNGLDFATGDESGLPCAVRSREDPKDRTHAAGARRRGRTMISTRNRIGCRSWFIDCPRRPHAPGDTLGLPCGAVRHLPLDAGSVRPGEHRREQSRSPTARSGYLARSFHSIRTPSRSGSRDRHRRAARAIAGRKPDCPTERHVRRARVGARRQSPAVASPAQREPRVRARAGSRKQDPSPTIEPFLLGAYEPTSNLVAVRKSGGDFYRVALAERGKATRFEINEADWPRAAWIQCHGRSVRASTALQFRAPSTCIDDLVTSTETGESFGNTSDAC